MSHNMTVTIDEPLWKEMKKHSEIRWSAVMKEAARRKLEALKALEQIAQNSKLSEKEIEEFVMELLEKEKSGRKGNKQILIRTGNRIKVGMK